MSCTLSATPCPALVLRPFQSHSPHLSPVGQLLEPWPDLLVGGAQHRTDLVQLLDLALTIKQRLAWHDEFGTDGWVVGALVMGRELRAAGNGSDRDLAEQAARGRYPTRSAWRAS
jgi:hypothetical protein